MENIISFFKQSPYFIPKSIISVLISTIVPFLFYKYYESSVIDSQRIEYFMNSIISKLFILLNSILSLIFISILLLKLNLKPETLNIGLLVIFFITFTVLSVLTTALDITVSNWNYNKKEFITFVESNEKLLSDKIYIKIKKNKEKIIVRKIPDYFDSLRGGYKENEFQNYMYIDSSATNIYTENIFYYNFNFKNGKSKWNWWIALLPFMSYLAPLVFFILTIPGCVTLGAIFALVINTSRIYFVSKNLLMYVKERTVNEMEQYAINLLLK